MTRARPLPLACAAALAVALAPAREAEACQYATCQSEGAVQKPAGLDLSLPFKSGETVKVLSGYGPNAGSSLHCRAQDSSCANDWYALDLILPNYANSGKGQPVLAAAAGTILDAAWGPQGWASYGQRVYIQHDVGDGHKYVTMYAHLDSINVSKGQKVAKGDVIGALGQSCNEAKSCANFSTPHVHFALHRDSGFGGTGSGGSYGGRAVIPEPIDGYTGLKQGQLLESMNGDQPPPPPPPDMCDPIPPVETVLDDTGPCLALGGKPENYGEAVGNNGHAYYTPQDVPSPDYAEAGLWVFKFQQAGNYAIWAFSPGAVPNLTGAATYKISYSGGQATKIIVDQSANPSTWVLLGTFPFDAGVDHWIRLGDNYEPGNQGKNVGIDDIRVVPAAACECMMVGQVDIQPCQNGGDQSRTCDGCSWSEWTPCTEPATTGDTTDGATSTGGTTGPAGSTETGTSGQGSATSGSSGSGTGGADTSGSSTGAATSNGGASATAGWTSAASGFDPGGEEGGCGCRSTDGPAPPLWFAALPLLAVRRRRDRR